MRTLFRERICAVVAAETAQEMQQAVLAAVPESDALIMAAADGFRLSVRTAAIEPPAGGAAPAGLDVIVPARAMQEVARIAAEGRDVAACLHLTC